MRYFVLCIILVMPSFISAQDVIVKQGGETIIAKVLEVNTDNVRYKKHSNLNGPTYTLSKSELMSINYENGEKDIINSPASETLSPTVEMSAPIETVPSEELTSDNILKAGTEIAITPMSEILAKKVKVGQKVLFSVLHDVTVGDKVVIRAGTTICGVVIERKSSRNYGVIKRIKLYRDGNSLGVLQIRIDNILYNEQNIQLVNNIVSAPQLPYNKANQKWYDKGHDWSKVLKRSDLIPLGHVLTLEVASDIKL